jgi:hypothetical protein
MLALVVLFVVGLSLVLLAGCAQEEDLTPGDITGRVYLDENADSECDVCDCDFYLEGIEILLYEGTCGGVIHETTNTNAEGVFNFTDLKPGDYCVTPRVKTICEGYKPTTPIQQKTAVLAGETVEVPWFGFDNNLEGSGN